MGAHNGLCLDMADYVARNPGCTRAQLLSGCGVHDARSGIPTYCVRRGMIHPAGPRGNTRYYPTHEEAAAAHGPLLVAVAERALDSRRRAWRKENDKLLVQRAERRSQVLAEMQERTRTRRRIREIIQSLGPDVTLATDVRITIAPPMRDRWA